MRRTEGQADGGGLGTGAGRAYKQSGKPKVPFKSLYLPPHMLWPGQDITRTLQT